jgi:phosphatidylserine synthase
LFAGFTIVQAMNLTFDQAAIAIFVAMVLDSLDGRVAVNQDAERVRRRIRQLADMVSFGAARAGDVRVGAAGHGQAGLIAAFVYCAGTALRSRASTRCRCCRQALVHRYPLQPQLRWWRAASSSSTTTTSIR